MLVLLDLDGTLTDPYAGISAGIKHAFEQLGVPVPDEAVMRSMIGPPFQETFPALGIAHDLIDEAIAAYRSVYDDGGKLFEATLYDGIERALDTLLEHGHTLALATSKPEEPARRIVEHFAILDRLTFVGGATADGTRRHKADVIDHVLRVTGTHPSEAVMVGDRNVDVIGARAHGLQVIGVRWGYAAAGELDDLHPTAIVEHPSELPGAVASIANG